MEEMWNTLPQEIFMEILSWIPAKSLINSFKFVCKPWRTIIQDPAFVKMHLNRGAINGGEEETRISHNNNNNHNQGSLICKAGNALFQLHPPFNYEGVPIAEAKKLDFDAKKLEDFDLLLSRSKLVGSCNGLLCIRVIFDQGIILLNPSTKKYKLLPEEPIESHHNPLDPITYGFGCYNNSNSNTTLDLDDEYKVVRIVYFYSKDFYIDHSFQFQIDIYSMSSNSWTRMKRGIKDFPSSISDNRSAVFLNGALHWTGSYSFGDKKDVLISFDIRNEDFRHIAMPASLIVDKPRDKILINMRGCLGIICVCSNENTDFDLDLWVIKEFNLDIWVMKEYGIRESWTREFVIRSSNTDPPRVVSDFFICFRSRAWFLKGDQLLVHGVGSRMALYDMKTKKIDGNFKMVGIPHECVPNVDLDDYIETLVSLKSSQLSFEQTNTIEEQRVEV